MGVEQIPNTKRLSAQDLICLLERSSPSDLNAIPPSEAKDKDAKVPFVPAL